MYFDLVHVYFYNSDYFLTFLQFKKKTSKGKFLTKYVVLFSFILVAVVLSTIIASYVSTKSIMDATPNQINQIMWTMPEWNILENLPSNLTEMKHALQLGKHSFGCAMLTS